jgi:O-acetylserine/cysteine efflux transporter
MITPLRKRSSMKLSHLAVAALVCLVWGANTVAAKVGVNAFPPIFFTALRFLAVLVFLSPWLRTAPVRGLWGRLVPAVFFIGALHFALIFTGVSLSSASAMAIVAQLYVPFAALIAMFWLGEMVPLQRWIGIALAFAGVVLFTVDGNVSGDWLGILFLVFDAVVFAIGTVLVRRIADIPPFVMQAWMAAIGFPFLMAVSLLIENGQLAAATMAPPKAWAALAYTVVGASLVGHTGYYFLLQRYDVSLVSSMLLVAPLVGVFAGVLFLDEPLTPLIAIGSLMTISGVAIVLIRPPAFLAEKGL